MMIGNAGGMLTGALMQSGHPSDRWMHYVHKEVKFWEQGRGDERRRVYQSAYGISRDTAWCSCFVNWIMKQAGIPGTGNMMARSWLSWGKRIYSPRKGCIVILNDHMTSNPWFHVAFFERWYRSNPPTLDLVGGNQGWKFCPGELHRGSDHVGYSRFPLGERVKEAYYVWPLGV